MVEASVLGISLQEDGKTPILLLFPHNSRNIVSISVGPLEAFALSTALSETPLDEKDGRSETPETSSSRSENVSAQETAELFSSPLIHQLLQKSIHSLGGNLIAVEITRTGTGELASTLVLQGAKGEERLDCRPSDGIALAVRCGALVRITEEMAAEGEDIEKVMPALSDDMKTIVAAKLLSLQDDKGLAPIRDSLLFAVLNKTRGGIRKSMVGITRQIIKQGRAGDALETALSEAGSRLAKLTEKDPQKKPLQPKAGEKVIVPVLKPKGAINAREVPVQATTIENQDGTTTVEALVVPGQTIVLPTPQGGGKAPTIRISLVRQPAEGPAEEGLDAFLFPSAGIAKEALGGLSLSRDEVKAVGNALSEEERLTTLLRLLSPETKVPM